jgi:superfamily II RNA helicase
MGSEPLSVATFRQMAGRAGRMNLDSEGEAVLMAQNTSSERRLALLLASGDMDPLKSSLHCASGGGLEKLLLEMFLCGGLTEYDFDKLFCP